LDTKQKNRLLVAVRPRGVTRLVEALDHDFILIFCHSLANAQKVLGEVKIDAIVCGTNFDESKMFDLLRYVKSTPAAQGIPFVSVKVLGGILHQGSYEGVKKAIKLLGAAAFIDLAQWEIDLGKDQADGLLRNTVHQLIQHRPLHKHQTSRDSLPL
jgi:response regulator RpfG family c-di-GMP phosphodiesterase